MGGIYADRKKEVKPARDNKKRAAAMRCADSGTACTARRRE